MKTLLAILAGALLIPALSLAAPVVNANLAEPRDYNIDLGCSFGSLKGQKFPTTVYDLPNRERITYNVSKCTGGYILGVNTDTGKEDWHADIAANGAVAGSDLDGHKWKYDPKTHTYTNLATGRSCPTANLRHVCSS